MSLSTNQQIWLTLAQEHYPTLTEERVLALCMPAASDWYDGADTELATIFDQYVMLKTLRGNKSEQDR